MSNPAAANPSTSDRVVNAESLVGWSSGPALAIDSDDSVVSWNEAATELLGFGEKIVKGHSATHLLEPRDIFGNAVIQMGSTFFETVIRGQAVRRFEVSLRTETGDSCRVEVSVVVVVGRSRDEHRFVLFLTPVRHRRRADEAIERLLAQTGDANSVPLGNLDGAQPARPRLTERQHEVLCLLAVGNNVNQIARDLGISVHTVRNHVQSILRAFEAQSQLEAVTKAMAAGYLTRRSTSADDRRDRS